MDKRYQVFVSSTYTDLIEERKEVTQAILKCNCFPAGMELFPASNKNQWSIIKKVIDDSDFYLLIIAGRYGSLGTDDNGKKVGYTEMEFNYALEKKKPIIVFLHQNPDALPNRLTETTSVKRQRLEKFRERASSGRMVRFWNNKDQLHSAVLESLHKEMMDTSDIVGWIRADSVQKSGHSSQENVIDAMIVNATKIDDAKLLSHLSSLTSPEKNQLFQNILYIDRFSKLFGTATNSNTLVSACDAIPYHFSYSLEFNQARNHLKNAVIPYINQCLVIDDYTNKHLVCAIKLLEKLSIVSEHYIHTVIHLFFHTDNKELRTCSMEYLREYGRTNRCMQATHDLLYQYCVGELNVDHSAFSSDEICELMGIFVKCISDFDQFCNTFQSQNSNIQKLMLHYFMCYVDSNLDIVTPKMQRKFFQLIDTALSWNDDEFTAEVLLYCLFTRTYDIYIADEIFDKVCEYNDDVFQIFFWELAFGESNCYGDDSYELDDDERKRIKKIIIDRNHPRGRKLIEHLEEFS